MTEIYQNIIEKVTPDLKLEEGEVFIRAKKISGNGKSTTVEIKANDTTNILFFPSSGIKDKKESLKIFNLPNSTALKRKPSD